MISVRNHGSVNESQFQNALCKNNINLISFGVTETSFILCPILVVFLMVKITRMSSRIQNSSVALSLGSGRMYPDSGCVLLA